TTRSPVNHEDRHTRGVTYLRIGQGASIACSDSALVHQGRHNCRRERAWPERVGSPAFAGEWARSPRKEIPIWDTGLAPHTRWLTLVPHMARRAWAGGIRAARMAGSSPAMAPMTRVEASPPAQARGGMTAAQCLVWA